MLVHNDLKTRPECPPSESEQGIIDDHLEGLKENAGSLKQVCERHCYKAPEAIIKISHSDGIAGEITVGKLYESLVAQDRRIRTLTLIRSHQPITEADHVHLMKLPDLKEAPYINNYWRKPVTAESTVLPQMKYQSENSIQP